MPGALSDKLVLDVLHPVRQNVKREKGKGKRPQIEIRTLCVYETYVLALFIFVSLPPLTAAASPRTSGLLGRSSIFQCPLPPQLSMLNVPMCCIANRECFLRFRATEIARSARNYKVDQFTSGAHRDGIEQSSCERPRDRYGGTRDRTSPPHVRDSLAPCVTSRGATTTTTTTRVG